MIVPCYRYGRFLRECVESVLAQSLTDVRVLIIDDASPDNTHQVATDVVESDPRVTFVRHPENRGHIASYNEGIEWASSDYMLILSADDYLLPGALKRAADLMDAHPEVGLAFGRVIELGVSTEQGVTQITSETTARPAWNILSGWEFIKLSASRNIVSAPTAVVRTSLQKQLGGYRAELPHSGDMEMWLRFAAHSSIARLDDFQAVYRRHGENMSLAYTINSWLPDLQQRKTALACFFESSNDIGNQDQLRRKSFRWLGRYAIGFASMAFNEGQRDSSERLSKFAIEVCPELRASWAWIKLTCKRHLGLHIWRALQPVVARIRRTRLVSEWLMPAPLFLTQVLPLLWKGNFCETQKHSRCRRARRDREASS